ncbi:MAG: DeoR/GlpR family DNA-binding transcription regulator [Lachnospiraceae bacterium]
MGMKTFRLRRMEQYVLEKDTVSMEELCREFGISMNTARLDVAQLVSKGSIKKVYGGVCSNRQNSLVPFEERKMKNSEKKRAVCKAAAELVEDGDIIYIDSGTTTMYLVDFLESRRNITILTHNLNAIMRAIPYPDLQVICLPGTLDRRTNSFVAADTGRVLERYNIKKAFIAAAGIAPNGDITNSSPMEFEIKRAAIENSSHVYLMVDSSKYGKTSLLTFASVGDMERIIADSGTDKGFVDLCAQNNVALELVEPEK